MAHQVSIKDTTANSGLDAITTAIGTSGLLRIYDSTQPTNADTALGAQVKLAELACSATFAAAASGGVLTANAISTDTAADATGTASWFTLTTSAGVRIVDGTVGVGSTFDLNINSTAISSGASVAVTSLTITIG